MKMNCTVIVNWAPKVLEAELPWQLVNALVKCSMDWQDMKARSAMAVACARNL